MKPWAVVTDKRVEMPKDVTPRTILVPPSVLVRGKGTQHIDWLVTGLIERNTRGLVIADPKVGKSLLFLDLCVSLATNTSFLGLKPYGREVSVAIVSREDGPVILHRRLENLCAGRGLPIKILDRHMLTNTEEQSSSFQIDKQSDLDELAEWLKAGEVEFCVIDVLNRLHGAKENSTDDMTGIMKKFDELAQKSGAQMCVIHHSNKGGGSRGSSAITGWADFICKLEADAADEATKRMYMKTKSSGHIPMRTLRYWQSPDELESRIMVMLPENSEPQSPAQHWTDKRDNEEWRN